ncbi:carbohydrate ABC transporter permease [Bullifex porci]|uniref:carbohydrate ABC transporter permease n=1 Tax=Bullifex porci TaxID=2606638 RepID=UPI0023F24DEA|nr:carbohydrate ABC transporter permease [Bullifex porci]MDD7256093.1 carbohydrate ABC transporter permease [Bullifex porci]MDY2741037.1 carbohydrate ABC transporter permease [Bullifex porci]
MKIKKFTYVDLILTILFFFLVIVAVFPLFWMLVTSFKTQEEIMRIPTTILPANWYLGSYIKIFTDEYFPRYFLNTCITSIIITVVSVAVSALVGYVFAKFKFPFKALFFYAILATIMVPFESFVVPLYNFVRSMHWTNTYLGIVFPSIISSFGMFFMKQNMEQIPDALVEAARIDGAGNYKILGTIILPLSVSSISVLSILLFLIAWSEYLWPLIVISKKNMYVLEIGLTLLQDEYFIDYGVMMAGCAVALIPCLLLFIFFRRYIMDGIAMSGIKG